MNTRQSMKMLYALLLCIGLSLFAGEPENLLKNHDFSKRSANGAVRRWKSAVPPKGQCLFGQGSVTLTAPGEAPASCFQEYIAVPSDTPLSIGCRVRGDGYFRLCIDWPGSNRAPIHGQWQNFTKDWRSISSYSLDYLDTAFEARLPKDNQAAPRLLLEVRKGTITFEQIRIGISRPPNALGVNWKIAGASRFVPEGADTTVHIGFFNFNEPSACLPGVKVKGDTWYELTYEIKPGRKTTMRGGYHNHKAGVRFTSEKEARYSTWRATRGAGFEPFSYRFKTPANDQCCDIHFSTTTEGTLRNIALKEFTPVPLENAKLTITSPLYRDSIYHSLPVKVISGEITDMDGTVSSGQATLSLKGTALQKQPLQRQDGAFVFAFDASSLADGDYDLIIQVKDAAGVHTRALAKQIRKLPPAPMEIVAGQDRRFYINGKFFFPIDCGGGLPRGSGEAEYAYAAAHGLNLITSLAAESEEQLIKTLDRHQIYGMKVILMTYFCMVEDAYDSWLAHLKTVLTPRVLAHPALFGYNLVDEPYECGYPPELLVKCYQTLKALDPYHPVWLNCGPPGTLEDQRQFMAACDFTSVDIYPVGGPWHSSMPDKSQTCVEKYTRWIRAVCQDRKPVMMCLQGYSWGEDYVEGPLVKNPRYPTLADMRLVTYTSLFQGAAALEYYSLYGVTKPDVFYPTFFTFLKELNGSMPLLIHGKVLSDVEGADHIRIRTIEHSGHRYLFVLNMSEMPRKAAAVPVPFKNPSLTVIHENRTLPIANGGITDSFAPYDVHIYAVAPLPPPLVPLPVYPLKPGEPSPWITRQKSVISKRTALPYRGHANWIWAGGGAANKPGSQVWLARTITTDRTLKRATLKFSADDMATAYLDGQEVGKVNAWNILRSFDVTKHFNGKNSARLLIHAADGRLLPCGVLCEILIEYADGSSETILSDASWTGTEYVNSKVRFHGEMAENWEKAVIIAPYGSGAWKDHVQLEKK